ncbi:extracellular solute-binding protein [Altererythrobacter sp. RZ02]|uniref:Extracellular solute-binding protein n=1 Tax=Pontixanthobacter rizhaonensis TaxID=2730337 RepID=A0A848QH20_9SPHN|nr:extracellular solute-binding protein [Pontixanthobacter rizhaonensis]NMW32961.1 extracellular solute-binding protein [Pontixanthobacter rizhaonensis]
MRLLKLLGLAPLVVSLAACGEMGSDTGGDGDTLVVFSSRHYDSDYALYEAFEKETGVDVRTIEADGDLLVERVKTDGENSPADVIITVDAGRLWRAEQEGLFAPVTSPALEEAVPSGLRHPDGLWYGLASRARVIVQATDRVSDGELTGYESLADPKFKGRVCVRSSGNIYNISLLGALIDRWGEDKAEAWATGVASNFARAPLGGDTDQIKAVIAGECDVALVNHYYFARLMREEPETLKGLEIFWPEEAPGVHLNVSGIGVAKNAPHPELALQFIEFAMQEKAQRFFAELTGEYPVTGVAYDNPALPSLDNRTIDPIALGKLGENQAKAQQIFDKAGWP